MSVHVEKVAEGNYRYVIELPRRANGKRNRKKKSGFKNKTEAKKAGLIKEREYIKGEFEHANKNMLFSDFLDFWIEREADSGKFKNTTITNYKKVINNHLKPMLGHYSLGALNAIIIEDFLNRRLNEGYKENTLSNIKGVLSKALEYAFKKANYIERNPAQGVEIPKRAETKKYPSLTTQNANGYITEENISRLLERFPEGNPAHIPIILAYRCGLRESEVYALTWEDIDFYQKALNVNKQLQYDSDEKMWYFAPPKYNSCRIIGIDNETLDLLKREKERQKKQRGKHRFYVLPRVNEQRIINFDEGKELHFVIRAYNGRFISPGAQKHIGRIAHLELGIPFTFHSLRHTHATMLAEAGFSQLYVQERLGHKTYQVTAKYYIHVTDKTRLNEQYKLEEFYAKKDPGD